MWSFAQIAVDGYLMNNELLHVFGSYLADLNLKFRTWEFKKCNPSFVFVLTPRISCSVSVAIRIAREQYIGFESRWGEIFCSFLHCFKAGCRTQYYSFVRANWGKINWNHDRDSRFPTGKSNWALSEGTSILLPLYHAVSHLFKDLFS